MIARRPPPTDVRILRLAAPLLHDTRYVVHVTGARSLSGFASSPRFQIRMPKADTALQARRRAEAARDSARADSTARQRPDSTSRVPAPAPTRPDTAARDTTRPRRPE